MAILRRRYQLELTRDARDQESSKVQEAALPPIWTPQVGPQTNALNSTADVTGYGGQAGGGKSDLLLGAAVTRHRRSVIFRREFTQLEGNGGLLQRAAELLDGVGRKAGNSWRVPGDRALEFGAMKDPDSWNDWAGRPHDFIGFDELPHFLENQVRAVMGWLRTAFPGQRCRVIMAFNPPTNPEGEWIIRYFAPWLDKNYPNPAKDGELRWYAMVDGVEIECADGTPFDHKRPNGQNEVIRPLSRTFFRARLEDNAYYMATNYEATLAALPEPLRSLLRYGAFDVAQEDHPWQVFPSAWVVAAQQRWKRMKRPDCPLSSVGVDVARGGRDKTVYSSRYENYLDVQIVKPGSATPNGQSVVRDVLDIEGVTPGTPIKVDVLGVGSSPTDIGTMNNLNIVPMNGAEKSNFVAGRNKQPSGWHGTESASEQGTLRMVNKRAEWTWSMRERLDPASGEDIALPDDPELRADLCSIRWKMMTRGVQIELKDDIKARIGRSPDKGESAIYAYADESQMIPMGAPVVFTQRRVFPG